VQQDILGNVTSLVNTSGNVVERYVYDPFGAVTVLNPDFSARGDSGYNWAYLYQGKRYDGTVGLYDSRERVYSPTLMRPLQADPLGLAPDSNYYRWEGNGPTDRLDPDGTKTIHLPDELIPPELNLKPQGKIFWDKKPASGPPRIHGDLPLGATIPDLDCATLRKWIIATGASINNRLEEIDRNKKLPGRPGVTDHQAWITREVDLLIQLLQQYHDKKCEPLPGDAINSRIKGRIPRFEQRFPLAVPKPSPPEAPLQNDVWPLAALATGYAKGAQGLSWIINKLFSPPSKGQPQGKPTVPLPQLQREWIGPPPKCPRNVA